MALETPVPQASEKVLEQETTSTWWLLVTLISGFAGAWLLPGVPPGLGLLIVASLGVASIILGAGDLSYDGLIYWGACVVLAGSATFLAAEWVIALDLLAAAGLAVIRATKAHTWRAILLAPFRVLRFTFAGLRGLAEPLIRRIDEGRVADVGPAARGALLGSILVLVFGALFISADAAFSSLLQDALLPEWDLQLIPFRIFVFVFIVTSIGVLVVTQRNRDESVWNKGIAVGRRWRTIEWGLPVAMLDALFLFFVLVQVTVLFGGRDVVFQTSGLTYAEYARQGFFQLLTVAALTLAVVAAAVHLGNPPEGRERTIMRGLLGGLCVLTLVVLESAFMRLALYEEAFGFTRLRLTVHATILWLAILFALLMWAGIRWKATWMPRVVVPLTAASFLAFSLINPDRFIAQQNVQRFERTGTLDVGYLATLSEDALPVLISLPEPERTCVLAIVKSRRNPDRNESWNGWNLSRARARTLVDLSDITDPTSACLSVYYD